MIRASPQVTDEMLAFFPVVLRWQPAMAASPVPVLCREHRSKSPPQGATQPCQLATYDVRSAVT
eukprot:3555881-Amphidinium_carterae.2